jgi:hypothetical protein
MSKDNPSPRAAETDDDTAFAIDPFFSFNDIRLFSTAGTFSQDGKLSLPN